MEPALGIRRCPLVQLALEVKYPPLSHIELGERRARVHRRPPPVQPCRVLTGPLRPVDGFPALHGGATATTTTGPPPRPDGNSGRCACPKPKGLGGHRRDASHVHHRPVGRVGAQLYPGGIVARYRNTARGPQPPDRETDGQDDPEQQPGPSTPTAHSRQFPGCCEVSGLLTLVRLLRLSALLPHPARWRRTAARSSGAAPALHPHLWTQTAPQLLPGRYGGRGWVLSSHPVIWRLVAHRRYWRGGGSSRRSIAARCAPAPDTLRVRQGVAAHR